MLKPVTIIGGGLAGLTLGIYLRRQEIPVTILEAGTYPRHKVCGEFISGHGLQVIAELGMEDVFRRHGANAARNAMFCSHHFCSPIRTLVSPALCLSRFKMDALLAETFRSLGGELRENCRFTAESDREGQIWASGRVRKTRQGPWRWVGLKVHARNASLQADLEMHTSHNGYIGLCRLSGGEVNICGLFRRNVDSSEGKLDWQTVLRGTKGSLLYSRLAGAIFDQSSFCAVAGLSFDGRSLAADRCCVGDALTMIPPVTGNGMSVAFESAQLSSEPLSAYCRGASSWQESRRTIARALAGRLKARLTWAKYLQWMMFSPLVRSCFGRVALNSNFLWRVMFSRTR